MEGAKETLSKFHPRLFIEFCSENLIAQGTIPSKLLMFLMDLGYTIYESKSMNGINSEYQTSEMIDIYYLSEYWHYSRLRKLFISLKKEYLSLVK